MVQDSPDLTHARPTLSWPLDAVRADGWFERVLKQSPEVRLAAETVGPTFFAMACLAGISIESLSMHGDEPGQGWIEFLIHHPDGTPVREKLPLPIFRERLVNAVVSGALSGIAVPDTIIDRLLASADNADASLLAEAVGQTFLLLSDVIGFRLQQLTLDCVDRTLRVKASIHSVARTQDVEVSIETLRQAARRRILLELQLASQDQGFEFDLQKVHEAETAWASRNAESVIQLLGSWHAPLHQLSRSAQSPQSEYQKLDIEIRRMLLRAVELLALAYETLNDLVVSESALRTAVQLSRDSVDEARFLCRLADLKVASHRDGEALALYRRAITQPGLDASQVIEATAKLGHCFAKTRRKVAALGCLNQLRALKAPERLLEALRKACHPLEG